MPNFAPRAEVLAKIAISNLQPLDLICDVSLLLGSEDVAQFKEATMRGDSTTELQTPVVMPSVVGTYPVRVFACGKEIEIISPAPTSEILRPNAPGDETSIEVVYPPTFAHWEAVSMEGGIYGEDEYRVYNWGSMTYPPYKRDLYNLPAASGSGIINYIRVYTRGKGTSMGGEGIRASIKSNGIVTDGDEIDPGPFYGWYSQQWNTNPANGRPWEWSDINNLQIGVSLRAKAGGYYCHCNQVYVEVNYTPSLDVVIAAPDIRVEIVRAYIRMQYPSVSEAYSGWISLTPGSELNLALFGSRVQAGVMLRNPTNAPLRYTPTIYNYHWTADLGYVTDYLTLPSWEPVRHPPAPTGMPYSSYQYECDKLLLPSGELAPGQTGFVYTGLYYQSRRWNNIYIEIMSDGYDLGRSLLYSGWYSY